MEAIFRPQPTIKKPLKKIRTEFTYRLPIETLASDEEIIEYQKSNNYSVPYDLIVDMMDFNTQQCPEEANFELFHSNFGQYTLKESDSGKIMILDVENSPAFKLSLTDLLKNCTQLGADSSAHFDRLNGDFQEKYQILMKKYLETVNNSNEKIKKSLERINKKAKKNIDYIESRWPFFKVTSFADVDSIRITSYGYSEKFLQKLGYSFLEFFRTYADCSYPNIDIVHKLSSGATTVFEEILKELFSILESQKPYASDIVKDCTLKGFNNTLLDSDLQVLTVFEPKKNGYLLHYYVICHEMKPHIY